MRREARKITTGAWGIDPVDGRTPVSNAVHRRLATGATKPRTGVVLARSGSVIGLLNTGAHMNSRGMTIGAEAGRGILTRRRGIW
jgi:hypothetical protein